VVLLEIVCGKRNTELSLSLIGYVSVFNFFFLIFNFFGHFIPHKIFHFKIVSGVDIVGKKQGVGFSGPNST
jgi:hypothetical protein